MGCTHRAAGTMPPRRLPDAPTGAIARRVVRSSDMDCNADGQGIAPAPAAAEQRGPLGGQAAQSVERAPEPPFERVPVGVDRALTVGRSDSPVGLATLLLAALALLVACGAPAASP